jgi:hypothetical protein
MSIRSLTLLTATGCILVASGCQATRTAGTSTPPAPSGPIQTTSNDSDHIPAGTTLAVRTNESIQTDTAGDVYSAEVSREVVSKDYDVVIPQGSPAELVVIRSDSGGTVGTPEIVLALRSFTVQGRKYSVDSEGNVKTGDEGLGRNERTAKMTGGGAVLGTVLGAIVGGGKGAAIGAAAGAAGGAAAQVLTRGDEVRVPAETVLSFKIQQPIKLTS